MPSSDPFNAAPLLEHEISAKIGALQQLDDAIAYRSYRLQWPCTDCTSSQKCTEHASDENLIETYKARYAAAWADAFTGMNPDDIDNLMQNSDLPPTAGMLAAAILASLRKAAAHGPLVTELDGRPVVIELDGDTLIEHALDPAGGDASPNPPDNLA